MKMFFYSALLVIACLGTALAQNPPSEKHGPPKVLWIIREEIKPGLMAAHNRHSEAYAAMFAKLGTENHRIAMTPVAGNENEVVYLTGGDSFAQIEQTMNGTDKKMAMIPVSMRSEADRLEKEAPELHAGMRDVLAIYRPELSFNPEANIPEMRYFSVTTVRVRPGHEAQYAEYIQNIVNVARKSAKVPDTFHIAGYQVISGAPGGTYLFFRPLKSLGELDVPIGMTVRNAMSNDMKKDADKAVSDAVGSTEISTYSFQPRMSFLPKEFTSVDAAFWTPAPAEMPKPKKKVARVTPAAATTRP